MHYNISFTNPGQVAGWAAGACLQRAHAEEDQQRDSQQVVQRHGAAKGQELVQLVQHLAQRHLRQPTRTGER